jgi:ppGpp synthetase/RelA/SpoT-type nucleotidyltranferase
MPTRFTPGELTLVDRLIGLFDKNRAELNILVDGLRARIVETKPLFRRIHSIKWRIKDNDHLRSKLLRKIADAHAAGDAFDITEETFFSRVNDLVGIRLLHLHTRQMTEINPELLAALAEGQYPLVEGPKARTWDNETSTYFNKIGIPSEMTDSMYTSVHYVIESNSRTKYTCEIQVRTLAEEIWGEVSHAFTYPHATKSIACQEQLKVLARVTSSCSRLVDSTFRSLEEFESFNPPPSLAHRKKTKRTNK